MIIALFDDAATAAAVIWYICERTTDGENKSNTVTVCGPHRSNKRTVLCMYNNIVFRDRIIPKY